MTIVSNCPICNKEHKIDPYEWGSGQCNCGNEWSIEEVTGRECDGSYDDFAIIMWERNKLCTN